MKIEQALALYLCQLQADGRSPHTIAQAQRHVRLLVSWLGDRPIAAAGHEDLARFLASDTVTRRSDGGRRKPTSANALRSSMRSFFGFANAAGYSPTNPARLIRRARCSSPRPRGLTDGEAERLLAAIDTATTPAEKRDRVMFRTMLGLGLRVGSVVALDVRDVDLVDASIRVRVMKNAEVDTLYLSNDLVNMLEAHIGTRKLGPLFARSNGARIGTRQVARRLGMWAERAGIPRRLSPHALRHAFAMRVYAATGDVLVTARAMCHRSVASTALYAQPGPARVRAAIAW